jgi:hypothetical protein
LRPPRRSPADGTESSSVVPLDPPAVKLRDRFVTCPSFLNRKIRNSRLSWMLISALAPALTYAA